MKKLIISTIALTALFLGSCKKDNIQPITPTQVETQNEVVQIETEETDFIETDNQIQYDNDDKAVDNRTKYLGKWKGTTKIVGVSYRMYLTISKSGSSRLRVSERLYNASNGSLFDSQVFYCKPASNKKSYFGATGQSDLYLKKQPNYIYAHFRDYYTPFPGAPTQIYSAYSSVKKY